MTTEPLMTWTRGSSWGRLWRSLEVGAHRGDGVEALHRPFVRDRGQRLLAVIENVVTAIGEDADARLRPVSFDDCLMGGRDTGEVDRSSEVGRNQLLGLDDLLEGICLLHSARGSPDRREVDGRKAALDLGEGVEGGLQRVGCFSGPTKAVPLAPTVYAGPGRLIGRKDASDAAILCSEDPPEIGCDGL